VTIERLERRHLSSALAVFVESFCRREPITRHLDLPFTAYEPFAAAVLDKAAIEELSTVAVDERGEVAAFTVAEDLAHPFVPDLACYPRLGPIFDLLDTLSAPFLAGRSFFEGRIAHVWIVGVAAGHRGEGLSTQVDLACVGAAAMRGFSYAYAEFTSELSERVTNQFPVLQRVNRIAYEAFVDRRGTKPFAGLPGACASYLAAIRPGVTLERIADAFHPTCGGDHDPLEPPRERSHDPAA
jgi:hypothetical protein